MRLFSSIGVALSIALSAFSVPSSLQAASRLNEVGSLGAACYILYHYAASDSELSTDNRPKDWKKFCKEGWGTLNKFGKPSHFPWIPSSILALYTLHEIAARYCFTKSSILGTFDRKRKKHKTLYNGSKIAMAIPVLSFWSKVLYSQGSNALIYAQKNPIAPLSLYLAGSHFFHAFHYLFPH